MIMKKLIFTGIAVGMMLSFSSCADKMKHDASGVFEATELVISARGTGELINFDIEEGMTVSAGEVLGNIDTLQLCLKRKQLMAGMSAVEQRKINDKTQLAALETQIANMKSEQQRFKRMLDAGVIPEKNYTDLTYQITGMELTLEAKREQLGMQNGSINSQLDAFEAQAAELDYGISNCYIKSPIDGVILTKYAEQGEFAAPGRILFRVGDISVMTLRAYITADQLSKVKVGQKVRVFVDYGKEESREYAGTLSWISDKAEFTPKNIQTHDERQNLVYAVKVLVENDGMIKKGMYGEIDFNTGK